MAKLIPILICIGGFSIAIILMIFSISRNKLVVYESSKFNKHRLILVVLDAFRHDYLEIAKSRNIELTNLQSMQKQGARIMKMVPVFPTMTMPNHQTLVTGLFAPYHGVTYNSFNDSSMNYDRFAMINQSSLNEARWYSGYPDPIWVSCEKLDNCRSGSMLWPNTDALISGHRPWRRVDQYIALNESPNIYPYDRRVDEMLSWMTNDLIDFGLIYFDEPDITSHRDGPLHENTLQALVDMDGWIGRLLKGISDAGLTHTTDVIVTADHGMTELSADRIINIDTLVPPHLYVTTFSYPVGIIYPVAGKEEEVYNLYRNASKHIKVYWRKDVPEIYNYRDNPNRISPIVSIVELGWVVNSSHYPFKMKNGNHGYSQEENDIKASLLAVGPSFKNVIIDSAFHVDLYPLMTHLLGMVPNPNNGSFARISGILKDSAKTFSPRKDQWSYDTLLSCLIFILAVQIIGCILHLICVFKSTDGARLIFSYKRYNNADYYDKTNAESLISTP